MHPAVFNLHTGGILRMMYRYNPLVPALSEARHRCRSAASDFNNLDTRTIPYQQIGKRRFALLKDVVGGVGEGSFVEPPFWPDYGCNVVIGKECFVNFKYIPLSPWFLKT